MINLILFEYKKFFKKKKNIISLAIFCVIIIAFIFINNSLAIEKSKSLGQNYQLEINSYKESLKTLSNDSESLQGKNQKLNNIIEKQKKLVNLLENRLDAHNKGDLKQEVNCQLQIDKIILAGTEAGEFVGKSADELKESIKVNQILVDKGIKPIIEDNSMTAYNFIRIVTKDLFPMMLPILILLLTGDIVSSENDEGTFKFLLTQPISRSKVMLSKVVAQITACVFSILIILSIGFIGTGIKFGFGSPYYPINYYEGSYLTLFYNSKYQVNLVDIKTFDLRIIPILVLFIVAVTSIGILISTLINNSTASICTAVIISVSMNIFGSQLNLLKKIVHIIPFTYSYIPSILNGDLYQRLNNKYLTTLSGIVILFLFAIVCNVVSILAFRKKDIAI